MALCIGAMSASGKHWIPGQPARGWSSTSLTARIVVWCVSGTQGGPGVGHRWLARSAVGSVGQRGGQQRGGSGGGRRCPPCCEGCIREVFELSPIEQLARVRGGENGDQGIT